STHPAGQCSVTEGKYKGMLFGDYVEAIGRERLGWKCQPFKAFPLMIKFIDAKENLSIQVHPDDDYALTNENEYGKNEMWYILDAEPDAYIYLGFNRKVTPEEIRRRIENETLTEVLNKVPVKKGQTYFLKSGTVHAIGSGIFICEIQQSSDATYRLYDYGRRDKNGQTRALHIDKALDVICMDRERVKVSEYPVKKETGYCTQVLGECKYFSTKKYNVQDSAILYVDSSSFLSIIITEGEGKITADNKELPFHIGDSFFIPAGKKSVKVEGRCEFLATQI
ncbi:MAG: type I phosphomannose isomerase catalytic subunit, partial [Christensenellaceae bacterium]